MDTTRCHNPHLGESMGQPRALYRIGGINPGDRTISQPLGHWPRPATSVPGHSRCSDRRPVTSGLPLIADIPSTVPLRALSPIEHSVTLAHPTGIRTWSEFSFKLFLWHFTFRNYTKST